MLRSTLHSNIHRFMMKFLRKNPLQLLTFGTLLQSALTAPNIEKRAPRVQYAGINIAGCEFGIQTDVRRVPFSRAKSGTHDDQGSNSGGPVCPSSVGVSQMQHFVRDDHLNIFRIPVGWQYLVNYKAGGPMDESFFGWFNQVMQACLNTGAKCILDIHNYARWYGGVIGQGGPSNDQFGNLWAQLAQRYANQPNVIFGLMNEPHDLDMNAWAATMQQAVYAIRANGATSQMILLSGDHYDAAGGFKVRKMLSTRRLKLC